MALTDSRADSEKEAGGGSASRQVTAGALKEKPQKLCAAERERAFGGWQRLGLEGSRAGLGCSFTTWTAFYLFILEVMESLKASRQGELDFAPR